MGKRQEFISGKRSFSFILPVFELRTQSSSYVCQPSCAPSGWTAPGLSAGPAVDGPLTASPPDASLWTRPCVHTNTTID